MRLLAPLCALTAAAALSGVAHAQSIDLDTGVVVFKAYPRGEGVTVVSAAAPSRTLAFSARRELGPCADPRFRFAGGHWRSAPTFLVNVASLADVRSSPTTFLPAGAVLDRILAGSRVWNAPFVTDCTDRPIGSRFATVYGGPTTLTGSLADGVTRDGVNVVEFRSLAGTICDGAIACTILDIERRRIQEADVLFEKDITRLSGFADYWTTSDTTAVFPTSAQFAVIDVAAHEWGHMLGLDNVPNSTTLTMVGPIHDGMQTLGLGDMLGARVIY